MKRHNFGSILIASYGKRLQSLVMLLWASTAVGALPIARAANIEIMSWVPPYSIGPCQTAVQADLGACDVPAALTRVGLQFWTPNSDGTIKYADHEWYTPADIDVGWWVDWGQANDVDIVLTVYNNDGNWNWSLARSAFATNRTTFVNALVAEMERLNLDGIDLDLEGLDGQVIASDRGAFDLLIHDLSIALKARGKILTVNSFHYVWNAPNHDWWSDWVGEVDNIHAMGYADLYEGGTTWHKYSFQQNAGYTAGYAGDTVLMGLPSWLASWGTSSGRGTSARAHVQEVHYDLPEPTGIAIWDLQLTAWQDADLWCEIETLKNSGVTPPSNNPPTASFTSSTSDLKVSFTDTSTDSDGTTASWTWLFGDGSTSTAMNPSYTYVAPGTYTVTLTVTDDDGATDSTSQSVVVTESSPQPPAAPSDLTVDVVKTGRGRKKTIISVTLNWSDNSNSETGFEIERCLEIVSGKGKKRTVTCDYVNYDTVSADVTTLQVGTESGYRYRVRAVNAEGASAYSNEAAF